MKRAVRFSILVCGLIAMTASSVTAGHCCNVAKAIGAQLGVRWQQPADEVSVGKSVSAIVMVPANLERYGMKTQEKDEVIVTRVDENKIVVRDVEGRQKLAFLYDKEGTLKLAE